MDLAQGASAAGDRRNREFARGALILAGLVVLASVVIMLADIRALFSRSYRLVAVFPEAANLFADAPVWIAGKPAGRVKEIALLPVSADTLALVAVTIELPRWLQSHVRADGHARLTATRLLGERVVDIVPGSAAAPPLRAGDTIPVRVPQQFALLRERLSDARAEFDTLAQTIGALGPPVAARLRALEPALHELELARAEADRLGRAISDGPAALTMRDAELRARIRRLQYTAASLRPAVERALGTADGAGRELREGTERLLARADTLAVRLAALELQLDDRHGFIGRSAADTALVKAWHGTRAALDSLMADVRRHPFRFMRLRF